MKIRSFRKLSGDVNTSKYEITIDKISSMSKYELVRKDSNLLLKDLLSDKKFIEELTQSACFDSGDNEWWVESRIDELFNALREKLDEILLKNGVRQN